MLMFWELSQLQRVSEVDEDAQRARRAAENVAEQVDKAMLACQAVWTLVRDKLGLTDEDLLARVRELDLTDGKLDGKARHTTRNCTGCHREVTRRFPRCMYCGAPVPGDPFTV